MRGKKQYICTALYVTSKLVTQGKCTNAFGSLVVGTNALNCLVRLSSKMT